MNRRVFLTAAVGGAITAAGCVDDPTPVNETAATPNTASTPEVDTTTIETTAVETGQGAVSDPETTRDDGTVTIDGVLPVSAVCDDWVVAFERVAIEDATLQVALTVEREHGDTLCQDVLGQVAFEATVEVTEADALTDVVVTAPTEGD